MQDPYSVLGISRGASDQEIKTAYRKLSRIYHPDMNIDNPNKDEAERKFKEVQQAYQQIMKEKEFGGSASYEQTNQSYGYGPFGGFYGQYQQQSNETEEDLLLRAAANYIRGQRYPEALNVLRSISERNSKWYYYSALANSGAGNNVIALEHAKIALSREPDNYQYQTLVHQLENGGYWYQTQHTTFGGSPVSGNGYCLKLCLANILCNLFCNGGCFYCGYPRF